jgi:hypothetical protein
MIPGPARVVACPVRVQHERHFGHVDDIDIIRQIDVAVAVEIFQILRRNPAVVVGPAHVAPGIAPDTAVDVDAGGPGPALMLTDSVTMPGAASAAVGVSSIAATKAPPGFMANVLLCSSRNAGTERAFPERLSVCRINCCCTAPAASQYESSPCPAFVASANSRLERLIRNKHDAGHTRLA